MSSGQFSSYNPLLLRAIESVGEAFEQRIRRCKRIFSPEMKSQGNENVHSGSLRLCERFLFCLVGGVNHVLCADPLRVGHGCHFSHSDFPVGGGGLRGGPLLQGPEADHEEGAV